MECVRCCTERDLSDYYSSDRTCKKCRCTLVRKNRAQRLDYYREYERRRNALPHRVEARKKYAQTDAGKKAHLRSRKKWLGVNGEKRAAHIILNNGVRGGRIEKPECCGECGSSGTRIHGHHDDYARPLEVRWVCPPCHKAIHDGLI